MKVSSVVRNILDPLFKAFLGVNAELAVAAINALSVDRIIDSFNRPKG